MNLRHNDLLKQGMALLGKGLKPLRKNEPGILIVNYHSISQQGDSIVRISPEMFQHQIRWLADHYEIVSLDQALEPARYDHDVIVITFDDGYSDYSTTAAPFLLKHGIPSTVYVITELVLNPDKPYPIQAGTGKRSMSVNDIADLRNEPLVIIGSHTHTHRNLKSLSQDEISWEMETAYTHLSRILGRADIHFSYPWAASSPTAERIAKSLYKSAVIGMGAKNHAPLNPYRLMRIPAKREPHPLFVERVQENLFLEYAIRDLLG